MQYAIEVIFKLVNNFPEIDKLSFIQFPRVYLLQDRINTNIHARAINDSLKSRNKYNLPFWDSLLLTQFNNELFSADIIKEACFHNSIKKRMSFLTNEIEKVNALVNDSDKNIGFNSLIQTKELENKHIPLLDFHIPADGANIPCVKAVLRQLNCRGYLLQTNRSFHFYGSQILSEDELITFLSRALLFSPIIDKNWVAHQLIERSATLRVSCKEGKVPFLIDEIL